MMTTLPATKISAWVSHQERSKNRISFFLTVWFKSENVKIETQFIHSSLVYSLQSCLQKAEYFPQAGF